MLTIESKKVDVNQSAKAVFDFLSNLNNLEKLMPEDRVEKWRSTNETCRFAIKNLGTIGMKNKSLQSPNKIVLASDGKNPFDFTLTILISNNGDQAVSHFIFEGDVNMFMSTMVKSPLKKFFDQLADGLNTAMA